MTQVYRFGRFELSEPARTLCLDGMVLPVQPLVFDFLAYLVRATSRAVSKDELLSALWPGVTVTEASLQRVASLACATLRQGDMDETLQSVPRFGYRLALAAAVEGGGDALVRAHAAVAGKVWPEAAAAFAEADRDDRLGAADLEALALAIECTGRPADAIPPLMRAVAAFAMAGKRLAAATPAIWLTRIHGERGDRAVARGWHKRVGDLIGGVESRQLGLWLCLGSMAAATDGEPARALELAEQACDLGRSMGDPVVEAMALVNRGFFKLCLGEAEKGVEDQDLAAALALSSDLDPIQGTVLYCTILWACRNFGEWSRASQWSVSFERWCISVGLHSFTGAYRLHRAEVLAVRGTLPEAEAMLHSALDHIALESPWEKGDALRVLGDIHVAAGRLEEAEMAYRGAYAAGWDPQPASPCSSSSAATASRPTWDLSGH